MEVPKMSKPKIAFARTFFSKKILKEIDIKPFDSDFDVAYNAIFLEKSVPKEKVSQNSRKFIRILLLFEYWKFCFKRYFLANFCGSIAVYLSNQLLSGQSNFINPFPPLIF